MLAVFRLLIEIVPVSLSLSDDWLTLQYLLEGTPTDVGLERGEDWFDATVWGRYLVLLNQ